MGRSLLPSAMTGRSRERGTPADCPNLEEPSPSTRRRRSVVPSTEVYPASPPGTAEKIAQRVAGRMAARCGNRIKVFFCFCFFFSLPSLVSVSPHASVSYTLASSVHTPRYRSRRDRSPRGGGEGGVGAASVVPPGLRGAMGVCGEQDEVEGRGRTARGRWRDCK